jgi:hypothetical protein
MSMPTDLSEFMGVLSDLAHRLQPLGQMAESASGLFGLLPFSALRGSTPIPPPPIVQPVVAPTPARQPARKAAVRTAAIKKAPAKKAPAKKAAVKKAPAKKR